MKRVTIFYATRSAFKTEELEVISNEIDFKDGSGSLHKIGKLIDFRVSSIRTDEPLEIDLVEMVHHKARSAYKSLLSPCIVEHAGLVFERNSGAGFPGGLTQPMWDSLTVDEFLSRTNAAGERAIARSVVGYCDGMHIKTFVGETMGTLTGNARGARGFYWDVLFCPDGGDGKTYAEIASLGPTGLKKKLELSQSTKALSLFASYLSKQGDSGLFALG
jgi:XTP/dITP diphosphohydrolase